jgi:hypothetical protein
MLSNMEPPCLPPHPGLFIRGPAALADYLRERGFRYLRREDITILVDVGENILFGIKVYWLLDQVRFVVQAALDFDESRLTEIALAVQRLNSEIGFPVWRVVPSLSATYTVTLNHEGALSSRCVEYAVALLRVSLVRGQAVLREVPGVRPP